MVEYIIQIAKAVIDLVDDQENHRIIVPYCAALSGEMKRLDPRAFVPDARFDFVITRIEIERFVERWSGPGDLAVFLNEFISKTFAKAQVEQLMAKTIAVLSKYGGEGWRVQTRSFGFIKGSKLREIIERDYKELTLVLFPGGAWKSTVIMAGSILEATLFDLLASDPTTKAKAIASAAAPKKKGLVIDMEEWRLESLIKVAAEIGILPKNREETFDQVLRDYRNFVHPKKEIKSAHPCGEGEAQLALGGLNAVCDILCP